MHMWTKFQNIMGKWPHVSSGQTGSGADRRTEGFSYTPRSLGHLPGASSLSWPKVAST